MPVCALKARLKGPIDWKPASSAMVRMDLCLGGIGQRRRRLGQPVAVDEAAEVAMAQPLVDQPAQAVFGHVERGDQRADAKAFLAIDLLLLHEPAEPGQHGVFLIVCGGRRSGTVLRSGQAGFGGERYDKRTSRAQGDQGEGRREPRQQGRLDDPARAVAGRAPPSMFRG